MRLKGLERFYKRVVTGIIAKLMGPGARGERPDWRERPYRVLFLRHDRIGDMILSTGILRAIAEAFPKTIQLDVLASPINAPVLRHEPYVHDIVVFDRKSPLSFPAAFLDLRNRHYDAVIDCMVTAPSLTTLLLMLATGARYRIGVKALGNDFAYTLPVPARENADHIVDKLGALVTAFGLQPTAVDLRPRIRLTAEELERGERIWNGETDHRPTSKKVLVNVSAGRAHHAWPDSRFSEVIRHVRAAHPTADIAVVSSPADRGRAAQIAAEGGARLVEDRGIRDAMSIVAHADVVFTPDTSISHVCSALGKTAVVLHPRGNSAIWGPYKTDGRAVDSLTESVTDITAEVASAVLLSRLS